MSYRGGHLCALGYIKYSIGSVKCNIDFITKLAVQCRRGMLTFGMKIFIRPGTLADVGGWTVGGWTVGCLARPNFAFAENCLGCTEVSKLPLPESLCMMEILERQLEACHLCIDLIFAHLNGQQWSKILNNW